MLNAFYYCSYQIVYPFLVMMIHSIQNFYLVHRRSFGRRLPLPIKMQLYALNSRIIIVIFSICYSSSVFFSFKTKLIMASLAASDITD